MKSETSVEDSASESAFPLHDVQQPWDSAAQCFDSIRTVITGGLTKREYIATMALQGILANANGYNDATYKGAARDAVLHADTLLEALAKPVATFTGDDDE